MKAAAKASNWNFCDVFSGNHLRLKAPTNERVDTAVAKVVASRLAYAPSIDLIETRHSVAGAVDKSDRLIAVECIADELYAMRGPIPGIAARNILVKTRWCHCR